MARSGKVRGTFVARGSFSVLLPTPRFWYFPKITTLARLLQPLGWLYGLVVGLDRHRSRPMRLRVPVVSIGNITLGGTGKTPLVIALAPQLQRRGHRVAVLLRGYGAQRRGPCRVDPSHTAADVGDEAMELQRSLPGVPVWVGSDRVAAGRAAIATGADVLLLDDGLQHWRLARDCDITVLEGAHGLGNGLVFPAGPLREPVRELARADLLVLTGAMGGPHGAGLGVPPAWPPAKPCFTLAGWIDAPEALVGQSLLAFCGIGLPAKFFAALRQAGFQLTATACFPDHHPYAHADLERLQHRADCDSATLVTTVKDWQRLPLAWQARVVAMPLVLNPPAVAAITDAVLRHLQGVTQGQDGGGVDD